MLKAQAGNFAVAVTAGAGTTQPGGEVFNSTTNVTGHYNYSVTTYDIALIAGKRLTETLMIYGGPFYSSFNYSGTIVQSGSLTGSYPIDGNATQGGANLGVQVDWY